MLHHLRTFLSRHAIYDGTLVVACSGGPDSLALLHALHDLSRRFALHVHAAHFNHLLRGADSDEDEAFVQRFCDSNTIPLKIVRRPVRTLAETERQNLEGVARRERYAWLTEVAHELGARWVATGHQAEDQAETVLHHLLRGTGLRGLRGIASRRTLAEGVDVIRPLLTVRRAEILAYLTEHQLEARQDRSNLDETLTRNRLRHRLLPLLAQDYNPRIVEMLGNLAELAQGQWALLEEQIVKLLQAAELPPAGDMVVLDAERLAKESRHLVREVFRHIWDREGWPVLRMTFERWEELADLVLGTLRAVDLPGGYKGRCVERVVQVGPLAKR